MPARLGDRFFRLITTGSGAFIVALMAAIAIFLVLQAIPALRLDKLNFFTARAWDVDNLSFGVLDLLLVTLYSSILALLIAAPISLGIALFLTHYAPRKLARPFAYLVDLLAAVPSIIFGFWGLKAFGQALAPVAKWFNHALGFLPIFANGNVDIQLGGNIFTAGIVLSVMLLPIITAVTREVFERTPTAHIEGALALGATKWEVIRTTVLPFGRAGFISAVMLGLGRALGETIALMIILSSHPNFAWSLFDGGDTIASRIARDAAEFNNATAAGAYIAAGLVLFVLTFAVNAIARSIVSGKKEYQ
ncbi:MAG: phosphate ABC transporter permease subunit PstC [Sciscionella sp.]|nr:phosphate ABC transporter permease subunit PstC [Sciscionella sp.]